MGAAHSSLGRNLIFSLASVVDFFAAAAAVVDDDQSLLLLLLLLPVRFSRFGLPPTRPAKRTKWKGEFESAQDLERNCRTSQLIRFLKIGIFIYRKVVKL